MASEECSGAERETFAQAVGTLKDVLLKTRDNVDDIRSRGCAALMHYMGRNGQIITEKRFVVTYLSFYANAFLNRPVWMGKYFRVEEPSEVPDLLNSLIQAFNQVYTEDGLRLCKITDEESEIKYVALVTERPHSKALECSTIFSSNECFLMNKIVEELSKSPDGTITRVWATQQANELPTPMSVMEAEEFLKKLFTHHWLKTYTGAFALGPRAIAELEANKLVQPSHICTICNRHIYCQTTALACPKCDLRTHLHCRKTYATLSKTDMIECKNPDCNQQVSREDWVKEPLEKRVRLDTSNDRNDGCSTPSSILIDSD